MAGTTSHPAANWWFENCFYTLGIYMTPVD